MSKFVFNETNKNTRNVQLMIVMISEVKTFQVFIRG